MASLAAQESKAGPYGPVAVPNGGFDLKKDGRPEKKKTENFDNVGAWTASSSAKWQVGLEQGSAGRRTKHCCYMNTNTWVEQTLTTHELVAGAFYTLTIDGIRSAEKADVIVVEVFVDGRTLHSEKLPGLTNTWREFKTQWQVPADFPAGKHMRLRLTMVNAWGQLDNVRLHCGKTATALEEEIASAIAEQRRQEDALSAAVEKGGTPLNSGWSIWEHRKQGNKMTSDDAYLSGFARVADFRTVQGFWQYWNQLPLPSEFFTNEKGQRRTFEDRALEGLSVFREGIEPTWEDPMNADGGEWFIRSGGAALNVRQLDEFWEQTVLGMIGESVDPGCEVCGARVVDKSKGRGSAYRLELWFRRNVNEIGEEMKKRLGACLAEVNNGRVPKLDYRNHKF